MVGTLHGEDDVGTTKDLGVGTRQQQPPDVVSLLSLFPLTTKLFRLRVFV